MPIPMDTQFGLDYGPAPLDYAAAQAAAAKKGKTLSQEDLNTAAGINQPTGAVTSPKPVTSPATTMPLSAGLTAPALPASGDVFDTPYFRSLGYQPDPKTAQDIIGGMVGGGMPLGEAVNQFEKGRISGAIGDVPGAKELEANLPGAATRFGLATAFSAAKAPAWVGSWLPGQVGDYFKNLGNKIETDQEAIQPSWAKIGGEVAGYALTAEMMSPLADAAAGAIAPRLPFLAKGLSAVDRLDQGLDFSTQGVEQLAPAVARLKKWQEGIKMSAQFGLTDISRGQNPLASMFIWPFVPPLYRGIKGVLGFGQEAAGKAALNGAYEFLADKAGVGVDEFKSNVNTMDQMLGGLRATGAPDHIVQGIYNAGTAEEFGNEWAKQVGNFAAVNRWNPDEVKAAVAAAGGKYQDLTLKAYDEGLGGLRGTAEDIKPPKVPTKTLDVVDMPIARGGVDVYMNPLSRWAKTTKLINEAEGDVVGPGSRVVSKEFENPLTVPFDPKVETPAEAMIKQQQGPLANIAVKLANRLAQVYGKDGRQYNDILLNLAGKLAVDGGYKAIHFVGPDVSQDIVADLSRFNPKVDLGELDGKLEERLNNSANVLFDGIPSYWLPLIGGTAITAAAIAGTPQQSQGMALPLGEIGEELGNYAGERLLKPFIEVIKPTGEAVRSIPGMGGPILHNEILKELEPNWTLPPMAGRVPGAYSKAGSQSHMQDALSRGFIRAGRSGGSYNRGPFVEFDANAPGASDRAAQFLTTQFNPATKDEIALDIHNKGELHSVMGLTDLNKALGYVDAGEIPKRPTSFRDFRNVLWPAIGLGVGGMVGTKKADGAMLPPEVVGELLSEGMEAGFPKLVEASNATAGVIKMLQINAPQATHEELIGSYKSLMGDVKDGTNLTVSQLGTGPSGSFGVSHPLTDPWYLATLHGPVDPDSGTWYADIKQAKTFGFGVDALKKVFGQVKAINPEIVKVGGKYAGLAMLAAAAYGVYDQFAPAKAYGMEPGPILEALGKELPGVGDEYLNAAAHNTSAADFMDQLHVQNATSRVVNGSQTFGTEGEKAFANMPQSGPTSPAARQTMGAANLGGSLNGMPFLRPAFDMNHGPAWTSWWGKFTRDRDSLITATNSVQNQAIKLIKEGILDENGINRADMGAGSEWMRAVEGLKMGEDGVVTQTETGLEPNVAKAAMDFKEQVKDPAFAVMKGITVDAHAAAARYGLDFKDPTMWKRMKFLQTDWDQMDPARNMFPDGSRPKASEIAAAKEMEGMLSFNTPETGKDLSIDYNGGAFTLQPMAQQKQTLQDNINQVMKLHPDGLPQDQQAMVGLMQNQLDEIAAAEKAGAGRRAPMMEVLARKQYFAPLSAKAATKVPAELQDMLREPDINKVVENYVGGLMHKMFFDDKLFTGGKLAQMYEHGFPVDWQGGTQVIDKNGSLADQLIQNLNVYRGIRSVKETAAVRNTVNGLPLPQRVKDILTGNVSRGLGGMMNWQYLTKLGGLRYPLVAATHPMLTTMLLGIEHLAPGYGAYLRDMAGTTAEAEAAGVLPMRSSLSQEMGKTAQSTAKRVADWADWLPAMAQNSNRVIAREAGKHWAADMLAKTGKFTPPSWLKYFDEGLLDGTHTPSEIVGGAADAVVRTTQFVFSPEGRALGLVGGPIRQLAGQFKGFASNYAIFMKNLFLHGKQTGEWAPFGNALGGLLVIGGGTSAAGLVPTTMVGINLYDVMRTELIKHGIVLPKGSLLGAMANWALVGNGIVDPQSNVGQALNAIQLGGQLDPLHFPSDPAKVPSWLMGPTMGGLYDMGVSAGKTVLGKQTGLDLGKDVASAALGPFARTIPEAAQEAGLFGDFFNSIGYRGGTYSPTGKALAQQPGPISGFARLVNWQPSISSQRYQYVKDMQAAMEGGHPEVAGQFLDEATRGGFIIDKREIAAMKGKIKREQSMVGRANMPLP